MRRRAVARAFTLVELLVAVAVIAALVAMVVPALARARAAAHQTSCVSNLKQIGTAFALYLNAHDGFYPCAEDPVSISPFYWLWMGRGWRGFLEPFFSQRIDRENPSVLFCKSDPNAEGKYEATSYAYAMCFYHTARQIDTMTDKKFTYSNPQPSVGQRAAHVASPQHKVLAGEWTSNHRRTGDDKGWWCWQGARNFLFADGHVRFLEAISIRPANDDLPDPNLTRRGIAGRDAD